MGPGLTTLLFAQSCFSSSDTPQPQIQTLLHLTSTAGSIGLARGSCSRARCQPWAHRCSWGGLQPRAAECLGVPARPCHAALCAGCLHGRAAVTQHCTGDRHWSILSCTERYPMAEEAHPPGAAHLSTGVQRQPGPRRSPLTAQAPRRAAAPRGHLRATRTRPWAALPMVHAPPGLCSSSAMRETTSVWPRGAVGGLCSQRARLDGAALAAQGPGAQRPAHPAASAGAGHQHTGIPADALEEAHGLVQTPSAGAHLRGAPELLPRSLIITSATSAYSSRDFSPKKFQ